MSLFVSRYQILCLSDERTSPGAGFARHWMHCTSDIRRPPRAASSQWIWKPRHLDGLGQMEEVTQSSRGVNQQSFIDFGVAAVIRVPDGLTAVSDLSTIKQLKQ